MEDARPIQAALGNEKMQVRVEIDPVAEGPDGGDDAECERAPGHHLKIPAQGPEGRPAQLPQQPPLVLEEHPR